VSLAWHDNVKITSTTAECTTGHATGYVIYHYSVFGLVCCTVFKNTKLMTKITWQTVSPKDKNSLVYGAQLNRYPLPPCPTHTHSVPWGQVGALRILIPDVVYGYKMGYSVQQYTWRVMGVARIMRHRIHVTSATLANIPGVVHAKAREVMWVVHDGLLSSNFLFVCFIKFDVSDLAVW
jgi:hypothetical protein